MDKSFSISRYLLEQAEMKQPLKMRVRVLCAAVGRSAGWNNRNKCLRSFYVDTELMDFVVSSINRLPEAITCEQEDFNAWLEFFMSTYIPETIRYLMRLSAWYVHFCCVEELLEMCSLVQRIQPIHLDDLCTRLINYFTEARKRCGMPSLSEPSKKVNDSICLQDADYSRITQRIVLQAEEYLGVHEFHSFIEKVMDNYRHIRTAEELAEVCGYVSVGTFRRIFARLFDCPVSQWLRQRRTEQIWNLLLTTQRPLQEIAEQCGFSNQSYLSDFCKRNLGDTPLNIRLNHKLNRGA